MPRTSSSKLYATALRLLKPAEKDALLALQTWLSTVRENSNGDPVDGRQLIENLKMEAHLTGIKPFGSGLALKKFLVASGAEFQKASTATRLDGHNEACRAHRSKGLPIPLEDLPEQLLRYSISSRTAASLIESVLGKVAKLAFDQGTLSPQEAFARMNASWSASLLKPEHTLGRGIVWATFDRSSSPPRNNARGMLEALALPSWLSASDTILFEFSYLAATVANHRFPTVADAGLIHLFRPGAEVAPARSDPPTLCGWTFPTGPWPAQPEIVHDDAHLSVLQQAPRFVGRIS